MADVITLSSDEEEVVPPKKRIKPTLVVKLNNNKGDKTGPDVVVLSESDNDDDDESSKDSLGTLLDQEDNKDVLPAKYEIERCDDRTNTSTAENSSENEKDNPVNPITTNGCNSSSSKLEEQSTSNDVTNTNNIPNTALADFLKICENSVQGTNLEQLKLKFPVVLKLANKCGAYHADSYAFKKLLDKSSKSAQTSALEAVVGFNNVYEYLKSVVDTQSIEVTEENRKILKKLEKTLKLLLARIKQLEEQEVEDDDEENSSYIQMDRFTNKLDKVYKKYCKILKKNPYSGRITYEKLGFVDSEFNEINRAINTKYKNNSKFPSYIEIENYIKKCVADNKLDLSENKIKVESQHCFKKLGELLQSRRKKELYDVHYTYIKDQDDPANVDTTLDSTLKTNFIEGRKKIDKICEEFVVKQEVGNEDKVSEESSSDNSNYEDSEKEEETTIN